MMPVVITEDQDRTPDELIHVSCVFAFKTFLFRTNRAIVQF